MTLIAAQSAQSTLLKVSLYVVGDLEQASSKQTRHFEQTGEISPPQIQAR